MSQLFVDAVSRQLDSDERLRADVTSWWQWRHKGAEPPALLHAFMVFFAEYSEFRSLAHYRFRRAGASTDLVAFRQLASELYIDTDDIGGGLRLQHAYSTWILAERIGDNCHINQNVTIGNWRGGRPFIGNNVRIAPGAVLVGRITVGDNVVIAPNAFVNFDVPAGSRVFTPRGVIVPSKPPAA